MAKAQISPQDAANKWKDRLSGAGQQIADGVRRVQVAPGEKAAAKKQKWLQEVTASADKWADRVRSVPLSEWQRKMIEVGVGRVASGAQANVGKYEAFAGEFLPHLQQGIAKVEAMPDNTIEERFQRAIAMMRHNSQFKRSR